MKNISIQVPDDLHEALKKVSAVECRSLHMQCLHTFYNLVEQYGYDIPITYEDNQRLMRSARRKTKEEKLKEEWEERKV
jgi:hypothetical protein